MSCALPSYVETAALVMHAPANRSRSPGGSGIRDTGGREHKRSERDTHAALGPGCTRSARQWIARSGG